MREERQTVEASIQYTVACLIQCLGILRRKRQVSICMCIHKKFTHLLFKPFSISRPRLSELGGMSNIFSVSELFKEEGGVKISALVPIGIYGNYK